MLYLFMFLCHILSFGLSGLNSEFNRSEGCFSTNSKISFMSSGDRPILTLKMKILDSNFFRFKYFANFDIKIVLLD